MGEWERPMVLSNELADQGKSYTPSGLLLGIGSAKERPLFQELDSGKKREKYTGQRLDLSGTVPGAGLY